VSISFVVLGIFANVGVDDVGLTGAIAKIWKA
jgi:hypothetical protein